MRSRLKLNAVPSRYLPGYQENNTSIDDSFKTAYDDDNQLSTFSFEVLVDDVYESFEEENTSAIKKTDVVDKGVQSDITYNEDKNTQTDRRPPPVDEIVQVESHKQTASYVL